MMKRTGLILIILLSLAYAVYAQPADSEQNSWPVKLYNLNYMITGVGDDQVKLNLSLMYDIFYKYKWGLYLGYTQTMFWALYDISSPFTEIDFNPELFWRFESGHNFLGDISIWFVDYIQLGLFDHVSNGQDGLDSHAINRSYLQAQFSAGRFFNAGLNFKYNFYYNPPDCNNDDYVDYVGPFEGKVFINLNNESEQGRWHFYARFGLGKDDGGNWTFSEGWQEYGLLSAVLFSYVRLYAQMYYGYGESLIRYNVKVQNSLTGWPFSVRAGIVLDIPQ